MLPWGWPLPENSAVNQLGQDYFLRLRFQAVHVLHPCHLILFLVRSRVPLQQFFHQLLHPVLCRLFHLPQVRVQGVSPRCRIRHIKDLVQARVSAGFIQQRNALGTTPDVTVHFIVPYIILGTGRSIRSLGIDHQLIRVTVFVQPCRCDQKFCPVLPLSRKAVCRFSGKCKIFFGFVWHLKSPFGFRVQKERAAVSSLPAEVWNDLLI